MTKLPRGGEGVGGVDGKVVDMDDVCGGVAADAVGQFEGDDDGVGVEAGLAVDDGGVVAEGLVVDVPCAGVGVVVVEVVGCEVALAVGHEEGRDLELHLRSDDGLEGDGGRVGAAVCGAVVGREGVLGLHCGLQEDGGTGGEGVAGRLQQAVEQRVGGTGAPCEVGERQAVGGGEGGGGGGRDVVAVQAAVEVGDDVDDGLAGFEEVEAEGGVAALGVDQGVEQEEAPRGVGGDAERVPAVGVVWAGGVGKVDVRGVAEGEVQAHDGVAAR